jgi:hypothetical protein
MTVNTVAVDCPSGGSIGDFFAAPFSVAISSLFLAASRRGGYPPSSDQNLESLPRRAFSVNLRSIVCEISMKDQSPRQDC